MLNQSNKIVRCIKSYVDIEESSSISSLLICVLFLFVHCLGILLFSLFVWLGYLPTKLVKESLWNSFEETASTFFS